MGGGAIGIDVVDEATKGKVGMDGSIEGGIVVSACIVHCICNSHILTLHKEEQ